MRPLNNNSFLPVQFLPSPENPCKQEQLYEPSVLIQLEFVWHSLVESSAHSSISMMEWRAEMSK
jgi:hypothetical protein